MCSHYQALKKREQLERYFRVRGLPVPPALDLYPGLQGEFIRRPPEWDVGDEAVPEREVEVGRWGMIPPGTRASGLEKAEKNSTFNAKVETADKLWTFRSAWHKAQHCIIPAEAIFEPDHRPETKARFDTKNAIVTQFTRADGAPMGIAGLWDRYRDADGKWQFSYTMLTINADGHPLFKHYHQATKEKRMVVILPDTAYQDWLEVDAEHAREFLVQFPAEALVAEAVGPYASRRKKSAPEGA